MPVIYRLNLKEPINYIVAQNFAIKDKDLIYVSNAPGVEFRKFISLVAQGMYIVNTVDDLSK